MTLATPPFGKILRIIYGLSLETRTSNLKYVALPVFELLAFNGQKIRGSRDPGHAPFWKNFNGVVYGLSLETRTGTSNLMSVALTILELLAFNGQNFRGSRDPGYAPFWENYLGVMYGLSLERCLSNLKSVALQALELHCVSKNVPLYFYDNFGKFRLILRTLSLIHSWMNGR